MPNHRLYAMNFPATTTRSVMLVDDEPLILESFGQLLRNHLSCPIHLYSSPADALQHMLSVNPAIIISDYLMPGMNGLKFLTQAQRFAPDARFVIITGGAIDLETEELPELPSLKGILRKPLHWRRLAEFVIDNWPDQVPPVLHEPAFAK